MKRHMMQSLLAAEAESLAQNQLVEPEDYRAVVVALQVLCERYGEPFRGEVENERPHLLLPAVVENNQTAFQFVNGRVQSVVGRRRGFIQISTDELLDLALLRGKRLCLDDHCSGNKVMQRPPLRVREAGQDFCEEPRQRCRRKDDV